MQTCYDLGAGGRHHGPSWHEVDMRQLFALSSAIILGTSAGAFALACTGSGDDSLPARGQSGGVTSATGGAAPGVGGDSSTGGVAPGTGGAAPTGGVPATAGTPATGGAALTGGVPATGGAQPTGGLPATGGAASTGGAPATGGTPPTGGLPATGGVEPTGGVPATGGTESELGSGVQSGEGRSTERYATAEVTRDGIPYAVIGNGWGSGWVSHEIAWLGTSLIIVSSNGSGSADGAPSSYPAVFCGRYSPRDVLPDCGLPAPIDSLTAVRTGWRWAANGNAGAYNAAYDIWVGDGTRLLGYLMVWLRDPPGEQPAGQRNLAHQGVTVEGLPGVWDVWNGTVNNLPIINWVQREGQDLPEIEFDVLDLVRDAEGRGLTVPGTHLNSVAVGFEIWDGPISNLETVDFYVHVE